MLFCGDGVGRVFTANEGTNNIHVIHTLPLCMFEVVALQIACHVEVVLYCI